MGRLFVNELGEKDNVEEVYRASGKQLRPNRNGNLYLQVNLSDRTGTVGARLWNASESLFNSFENGDYVRVAGTTQVFQGAIQLIAKRIERVAPSAVDEGDFALLSSQEIDGLYAKMGELLREVRDPALANLARCFLMDDALMDRLRLAPAGVKLHHAYPGGLLEHITSVMEVAMRVAPCYPRIDRDLLLVGAFLHDLAKVEELHGGADMSYSDAGQLIGHLVMGVGLLERKIDEVEKLSQEPFPEETALRLKHMILSHHGELENGSPKVPMTLEAYALYCLDTLDSKLFEFSQQLDTDFAPENTWTHYNPSLGRKLFKGSRNTES